jgi:hypothetical protein
VWIAEVNGRGQEAVVAALLVDVTASSPRVRWDPGLPCWFVTAVVDRAANKSRAEHADVRDSEPMSAIFCPERATCNLHRHSGPRSGGAPTGDPVRPVI